MPKWKSITTAPKDGTSIFVFGSRFGEVGEPEHNVIDVARWAGGQSDYPGNDWWLCTTGCGYANWFKPSKWMAIPNPESSK